MRASELCIHQRLKLLQSVGEHLLLSRQGGEDGVDLVCPSVGIRLVLEGALDGFADVTGEDPGCGSRIERVEFRPQMRTLIKQRSEAPGQDRFVQARNQLVPHERGACHIGGIQSPDWALLSVL